MPYIVSIFKKDRQANLDNFEYISVDKNTLNFIYEETSKNVINIIIIF